MIRCGTPHACCLRCFGTDLAQAKAGGAGAGCSSLVGVSPSPPSGFGAPPCATSYRSVSIDEVHQGGERPHIRVMPYLALSDDEAATLIKKLHDTFHNDRYPFSERSRTLKAILATLSPAPAREPLPPPKAYAPRCEASFREPRHGA
jgi:hypothetical protein